MEKDVTKAILEIILSLGTLLTGLVFIGLGTNLNIALGVFFLILYINSTRN